MKCNLQFPIKKDFTANFTNTKSKVSTCFRYVNVIIIVMFRKFKYRSFSSLLQRNSTNNIQINGKCYPKDDFTNVSPKIISYVGRNIHNTEFHPLCLLKKKIVNHFYRSFTFRGNPIFSVFDNLNPVVSTNANFDSLLIPIEHVSRSKSDCYYVNRDTVLRAHTTAHQSELILSGLDNFIIFGDVYRRDEIDSTHFPVFHQADAARLMTKDQLADLAKDSIHIFEKGTETNEKQAVHTLDATKIMEQQLKSSLIGLAGSLFGKNIKCRWVDVYFPFTHPSWELEIEFENKWLEVLGCGIMRHDILAMSGAENKIGWAFGLGLERLAMRLYEITDIRLFWSTDTGFLNQFKGKSHNDVIKYKPISIYPQCHNDMSFWVDDNFSSNDFFELVREAGGDMVEQVNLIDDFVHPKTSQRSLCYRITYRDLSKTLTQEEVSLIHSKIANQAVETLKVKIR